MRVSYKPSPIDTSAIKLPPDLEGLLESLSENTHEIWAQKRMQDGWTYGSERNDKELRHPCLIPYDQLPESEKDYDRVIVVQMIKSILALGYRIEKATPS